MRFTHATTSWLDGFDGLSRLMTPELMYDLMSRVSGLEPASGMGVKWPVRTRTRRKDTKFSISTPGHRLGAWVGGRAGAYACHSS
jgi:hypothetical protein